LEIATALARDIRVIPVLVQGAQMPRAVDLPVDLRDLVHRNALEVSDSRFRTDIDQLIKALEAPTAEQIADTVFVEPTQPLGGGFVGREQELAFLRQRVDAARRGEGSLVFITGEAGIGKTRLASEARPYARGRGFLWLEGNYTREAGVPLQPWVEAIRTSLRTAPPELMTKVLQPYAGELAKIVPEVAEQLGQEPSPPHLPVGPEEERIRLYEAMVGFFSGIAREQPLGLMLNDLQWAPSIDFLLHLARNVATERLLVLGTYRDVELRERPPLARAILALNRERLFHSLPLKRLGHEEVASMVTHSLGEGASSNLSEVVYRKTEGNPFFVEEVVRYLTESEAISLGEKGWEVKDSTLVQLPDSVKAVVGERLDRLGEGSRDALAWASVAGLVFTLTLLEEVTGLEEGELLEVVDQAVEARVLTPRPTLGQEAYAFADEVIQDALYEGIGPARRRRYHLRVGQGIEKVHARHLEEHYDALARHFLEGNDLEKAAEYASKAADRASSVFSWERAMGHYQTALELQEELESNPGNQAEVLEKVAMVTRWARGKGAAGQWEKALRVYETLEDGQKAAQVHLRLAEQYLHFELGGQDAGKVYDHSLQAAELLEAQGESPLLGRVYARLGFSAFAGRAEPLSQAIAVIEKGIDLSEGLGDAVGVTDAVRLLGFTSFFTGEVQRGQELLQRSCEEAKDRSDSVTLTEGASYFSLSFNTIRDPESALTWAGVAAEANKLSGTLRHQLLSAWNLAWASMLAGDAQAALEGLESAQQTSRTRGTDLDISQSSVPNMFVPGLVHFLLGEWDTAEAELISCLEAVRRSHVIFFTEFITPMVGQLYLELGDLSAAKNHLLEGLSISEGIGAETWELSLRACLAWVTCKRGELEEAATHLRRAQEILRNGEDWRGLAAEVHQADGILAATEQRWPDAETAFDKAVEINRQYHLPYYEARTLLEWGEMYLYRNEIGDRERGMQLLDQALPIFQRIQAKKMVEKVLARREVLRA
ncbi:MAG: BREX system ATP-binding domain-containing protein, partial [Dehalococcoidia bacterium]